MEKISSLAYYHCGKCRDRNYLIECACGCQRILFPRYKGKNNNHTRKYIKGHQARRELHYDFKGKHRNPYGYIQVFRPDHHFADKNGYVMEHRIVWEEYHKASLLSWAVVHHINGKKDDNRIENLNGMMSRDHKRHHSFERIDFWHKIMRPRSKTDMSSRFCFLCGSHKTFYSNSRKQAVWARHPITKREWICYKCKKKIMWKLYKKH